MTDIIWTNATVKLSQLQPWQDNPKTSTAKNAEQLTTSVDELGQFQDVAIGPFNGNGLAPVYDGHQRLNAWAHAYGLGYEVTAKQASRELTEQERRKVAIYSRQIGAWDWEVLSGWEIPDLIDWGMDDDLLKDWGRDYSALSEMLESEEEPLEEGDAESQINRADELRELWGVELGQLWRLPSRVEGQEHRLICGDCTDKSTVQKLGYSFDMMFTDPPYGVDYSGGVQFDGKGGAETSNRERLKNDDSTAIYNDFLPVVLPFVDGPCYMWFAGSKGLDVYNAVNANHCEIHALIIWHKTNATYAAMNAQYKQRHEPCLYFKPKEKTLRWCGASTENTLWEFPRDAKNDLHPTQKPITLATKAIGNHDIETVADFFCGSGSTIIAAENLSRQCRAVEISPAYVAVALQRYQDAFGITPELIG